VPPSIWGKGRVRTRAILAPEHRQLVHFPTHVAGGRGSGPLQHLCSPPLRLGPSNYHAVRYPTSSLKPLRKWFGRATLCRAFSRNVVGGTLSYFGVWRLKKKRSRREKSTTKQPTHSLFAGGYLGWVSHMPRTTSSAPNHDSGLECKRRRRRGGIAKARRKREQRATLSSAGPYVTNPSSVWSSNSAFHFHYHLSQPP